MKILEKILLRKKRKRDFAKKEKLIKGVKEEETVDCTIENDKFIKGLTIKPKKSIYKIGKIKIIQKNKMQNDKSAEDK